MEGADDSLDAAASSAKGPAVIRVDLRCPVCDHSWHAATIDPSAWWGKGITPETVAKQCYCVRCERKPPMQVVGQVQRGDLLTEASA